MFVRVKKVNGYRYLQLVENRREGGKVKQRVIATLGRVEELEGRGVIERLIESLSRYTKEVAVIKGYESGDIEAEGKKVVGPEVIFGRLWEEVGIGEELRRIRERRKVRYDIERVVFGAVLHRIYEAGSDRQGIRWLEDGDKVGLGEVKLHHFYRAMRVLGEEKDKVEEGLFNRRRNLFTRLSVVFFDTTSVYFEGEGGELGEYGYSRDRRYDRKQWVVGALLSGEGRPISMTVDGGSKLDHRVFLERVDEFRRRFSLVGEVCWVADRGIGTREVIEELEKRGFKYIFGVRMRKDLEVREEVLKSGGRYRKVRENLYVKDIRLLNGARYIICFNPDEAERERKMRKEILEKLEEVVAHPGEVIKNSAWRKYLKMKKGLVEINWEKVKEEEKYDGKWVLRTNTSLSAEEIALQYKRLWEVENFFRTAKSLIKMRPVYHKYDLTIKGHLFVSFLGILLKYELERRLKEKGFKLEWKDILRDTLSVEQVEVRIKDRRYLLRLPLRGCAGKVFAAVGVRLPSSLIPVQED